MTKCSQTYRQCETSEMRIMQWSGSSRLFYTLATFVDICTRMPRIDILRYAHHPMPAPFTQASDCV